MTKKFLSLVLSLALVVGLMPVMGVQAEAVAPVQQLTEDFENFTQDAWFNEDFSGTSNVENGDGDTQLTVGTYLKAKIVSMDGYNGETTKAIDIYTDSGALNANGTALGWPNDKATVRLTYKGGFEQPVSGKYVMEFRVFVPGPENGVKRSFTHIIAGPCLITMYDSNIGFKIGTGTASNQSEIYSYGDYNKWYKLTYVYEVDVIENDTTHANAASLYVDDVLVGYRENISSYTKGGMAFAKFLRIYQRSNPAGSDDVAKEHIIFDDFNFYIPGTTTPSSNFAGYEDVKTTDNITVDFDNMILNTTVNDEPTVSSDCVHMTDSAGNTVEIESVTASADCKSIIIEPKYDLAAATEYSVTVSGLLDMYSQDIEDYSFTFKTAEPNPIIMESAPTFTKENLFAMNSQGTSISALQNGYISANYTIKNTHATASKNVLMIVVLKTGDTISGFQFKDATLPAGESLTFKGGFNVTDAENQSIECYTWNSLYGMTPLADKYTITASGVTSTGVDAQ